MKYTELIKGRIYTNDFHYNDRPSSVIMKYEGKLGTPTHHINATGKYGNKSCCCTDSVFREPTWWERQWLEDCIVAGTTVPCNKVQKQPSYDIY